jgi:hypothetical protein
MYFWGQFELEWCNKRVQKLEFNEDTGILRIKVADGIIV